jgi:hypothetical protein
MNVVNFFTFFIGIKVFGIQVFMDLFNFFSFFFVIVFGGWEKNLQLCTPKQRERV